MGGPLIDSETGRIRRGTTAEQIRGPEPQQNALAAQHAAGRQSSAKAFAAGAELLLPATEDAEVQAVVKLFGVGLTPGQVYIFAYDRLKVSETALRGAMEYLYQQGIRMVILRVHGDPREAIRVVDAEDLAK